MLKSLKIENFRCFPSFELFDQVVLTSEEDLVIEALQILEPSVKRIAAKGFERSRQNSSRGNLVNKLKDAPAPKLHRGDRNHLLVRD